MGLRRSGRAVRHDDQPLAHVPEHGPHQRVEPLLRVHVPRRLGVQPVEHQPHQVPPRGRLVRHRGLPPRHPHLVRRAGDPRRLLVVPDEDDRQELARLPPARARLRQPGHPADAPRRAVRLRRRAVHRRRADRDPLRARVQGLGRDGGGQGPLRRLREEPRADAPRDGHAPGRGLRHRPRPLPRGALPRRARGLGRRREHRPRARLPQRAGDRPGADRHDRAPDGLRHHRHRARLLAGEVQEARRGRLLQDRQPVRARGAPPPGLRAGRGAGDCRLRLRHQHAPRRAARQPRDAEAEGPDQRGARQGRGRAPRRLRSRARLRAVGHRRRGVRSARDSIGSSARASASRSSSTSATRPPRSRRRTRPSSAG